MASYDLLQHTHSRIESPAKIFAKLKSKVQLEARCGFSTGFHSPRKKTTNMCADEEFKENTTFISRRNEAKALTLSPVPSPVKPSGCYYTPLDNTSGGTDTVRGNVRRDETVLESTALCQPISVTIRDQISGFVVPSRTPVKTQTVVNRGQSVKECLNPVSSASVFSPIKHKLRKRKLEQQEFNTVSRTLGGLTQDVDSLQAKRKSTSTEDYTHDNMYTKDLSNTDQSEMLHVEPMFSQFRSTLDKRCSVALEKFPTMSPAKMFTLMKERERKGEKPEVYTSSKRELFGNKSRGAPRMDEMEKDVLNNATVPVNRNREDSSISLSDADASDDALISTASTQPVLLEDPIVLNSPQIAIPKKDRAVFKRNHWPTQKTFPADSVIYLKKWFPRRNQKGLFVDGIHGEDNIPWNSNIIVERVSSSVLKTVSGRVYILVGKINVDLASDFPKWFLKKFVRGFPPNWKALYEKFMSESNNKANRNKDKSITSRTKAETSTTNESVKRQRLGSLKTSDSCPPSSSSSTKTSRSGRVIKPPLEYWKGGRVILDAHMNVTIHEGYDTFISDVSTLVSPRTSKKPVCVFLPSSEGLRKSESDEVEEASEPARRVRAQRNQRRTEVNRNKKLPNLPEPPRETLKISEAWCGKTTNSRWRRPKPATERGALVEAVPRKQRSKQTNHANRCSTKPSRSKRTVINSSESPAIDQTSSYVSSENEFPIRRNRRERGVHSKEGGKVSNKSRPVNKLPFESAPENRKDPRQRRRRIRESDESETKHKENKCTKKSTVIQTLPTRTQPDRRRHKNHTLVTQEGDEDKWTDGELLKLQEAASFYPKHITGYWAKVARMVGTRSAEECHKQHTMQGACQSPGKRAKKHGKEKVEAPKPPETECLVISARAGTLKRKQQVRQFLEVLPREDVDDAFSSEYMQNKRFEIPSMCSSDDRDFDMYDLEPQTPMSSVYPEIKTPQCSHITSGMIGSPNANDDDKYVYQLQKRMKKNQFNIHKTSRSSKRFTPTPSVKRTVRRCGNTDNDTFYIREMFPGNDGGLSETGEEEDFYFSDD